LKNSLKACHSEQSEESASLPRTALLPPNLPSEITNRKAPILALRLGLKYVRGLRQSAAQALVRERSLAPFQSIHDVTRRVPELRKDELTTLAEIGALNSVGNSPPNSPQSHRDTEGNEDVLSSLTSASG
jgi:DNA polymerase III alpha subunit